MDGIRAVIEGKRHVFFRPGLFRSRNSGGRGRDEYDLDQECQKKEIRRQDDGKQADGLLEFHRLQEPPGRLHILII